MSGVTLTDREQQYLDCDVPMIRAGEAAKGLTVGFLIGLLQAAFTPGSGKGDRRIIGTSRRMRYTRYKKAVLRKCGGTPKKRDARLLKKLNKQPFILDYETFDADAYTAKLYEEYMEKHQQPSSERKSL